MKVYSSSIAAPEFDFEDSNKYNQNIVEYLHAVKNECIQHGYNGKHTGKILSIPVADGSACYMLSDGGRKFHLVHLEIYDSYFEPIVKYMPKADVLKLAESFDNFVKSF